MTGFFTGPGLDFGCGGPRFEVEGPHGALAVRLGIDGRMQCAWGTEGPDLQDGSAVAVDREGGVIFGGTFQEAITLGKGTPNEVTFTADNQSIDLFLARYGPGG